MGLGAPGSGPLLVVDAPGCGVQRRGVHRKSTDELLEHAVCCASLGIYIGLLTDCSEVAVNQKEVEATINHCLFNSAVYPQCIAKAVRRNSLFPHFVSAWDTSYPVLFWGGGVLY